MVPRVPLHRLHVPEPEAGEALGAVKFRRSLGRDPRCKGQIFFVQNAFWELPDFESFQKKGKRPFRGRRVGIQASES